MLSQWDTLGLDGLVIGTLLGATVTMVIFIGSAVRGPLPAGPDHATRSAAGRAPAARGAADDRDRDPPDQRHRRSRDRLAHRARGGQLPALCRRPGPRPDRRHRSGLGRRDLPDARASPPSAGRWGTLAATSARAMHYVLAIFVPIAMLTMAVAPLAVSIAYGRGAFTPGGHRHDRTGRRLLRPAPGGGHARTDPDRRPQRRRRGTLLLAGGLLNVAVNISLDVVLGRWLGVAGIALASSIAETTVLLFFIVRLTRGGDAFPLKPLARTTGLALIAGAPVAIVVGALVWSGLLSDRDRARGGDARRDRPARRARLPRHRPAPRDGGAADHPARHDGPGQRPPRPGSVGMRPLRIAYVPASLRPGGAERQMLHLAERLPKDRFQVDFVTIAGTGEYDERARAAGATVRTLGAGGDPRANPIAKSVNRVSKIGRYIAHDPPIPLRHRRCVAVPRRRAGGAGASADRDAGRHLGPSKRRRARSVRTRSSIRSSRWSCADRRRRGQLGGRGGAHDSDPGRRARRRSGSSGTASSCPDLATADRTRRGPPGAGRRRRPPRHRLRRELPGREAPRPAGRPRPRAWSPTACRRGSS